MADRGYSRDPAAETLRRIKEAGGEGFPIVAYLRDPESGLATVDTILNPAHNIAEKPGGVRAVDHAVVEAE